MAIDVLDVFRFGAVDVAWQVEVVVVLGICDLGQRHHARVAWQLCQLGEGIDDLVNVLLTQAVLGTVLDEALGGVDHEDAFACRSVFLVQHQDAGGNACAVEQVAWQADDSFEDARPHQLLADDSLGIAPEKNTVRENAGAFAGALH